MDSRRDRALPPLSMHSVMMSPGRDDYQSAAQSPASSAFSRSPFSSPLARLLSHPTAGQALQESGVMEEVEQVVYELEDDLQAKMQEIEILREEHFKLQETMAEEEKEKSARMVEVVRLQGGLQTAEQEANHLKEENTKLQQLLLTEVPQLHGGLQDRQQEYLGLKAEYDDQARELEQVRRDKTAMEASYKSAQVRLIASLEQAIQLQEEHKRVRDISEARRLEIESLRTESSSRDGIQTSSQDLLVQAQTENKQLLEEKLACEKFIGDFLRMRSRERTLRKIKGLRGDLEKVQVALRDFEEGDALPPSFTDKGVVA